jgi:hypothetical protein
MGPTIGTMGTTHSLTGVGKMKPSIRANVTTGAVASAIKPASAKEPLP